MKMEALAYFLPIFIMSNFDSGFLWLTLQIIVHSTLANLQFSLELTFIKMYKRFDMFINGPN